MRVDRLLSPAEEMTRKRGSMLTSSRQLADELFGKISLRLGQEALNRIRSVYEFALSLSATTAHHPSIAAYMSHPVRIAHFSVDLSDEPTLPAIEIALIHNVYETSGLDEVKLEKAGFSAAIASDVRLLTIDRKHEKDRAYLRAFYSAIERRGPRLSEIRCLDKLDNLLGASAIESEEEHRSYVDLAEEFVEPMARRLSPVFGDYFAEVVDIARASGPDPVFRRRLDEFVSGAVI